MEDDEEFREEIKEKGIAETSTIEPIYEGDLEQEDIENKPILKAVANINNSFMDTQKLLNKSLFDYNRIKKKIDEMLDIMPKYSQTIIIAEVQKLVNSIEHLIFLADQQQETLKRTINEMVQISEKEKE